MANYNEKPYNRGVAAYHPTGQQNQAWRCVERTYAADDTIRLWKLERDTKITGGAVACVAAIGASGTVDLQITDGTTTKVIVDGGDLGTANTVVHMNDVEALGWVTDNQDYWVEIVIKTIGTPAAAVLIASLETTNQMIGSEGAF